METARTTLSASVEELRAGLLEVLTACPVEQCNPGNCRCIACASWIIPGGFSGSMPWTGLICNFWRLTIALA
jgi:hypothetical protein